MRALLLAVLLPAAPLHAAERSVGVGSFERVRVDGPFEVRIATGSPRATIAGDRQALDGVDLRVDGATLTIRRRGGASAAGPVTMTLSTPALRAATVTGAAQVQVAAMGGAQVDLSVAGAGRLAVAGLAAERAQATLVGEGRITLAGRARLLRLSTTGPGAIDASGVVSDEVAVRLDGLGETLANARYVATVTSSGSGRVVVSGRPKCAVRAPAGSDVVCGVR